MAKVSTNISIDADIKKQAQELFAELGMDLSTAINIFIRQALRQHSIPFEITTEVPNNVTMAAMESAEEGKDVYGPYDSVESLMEALNA